MLLIKVYVHLCTPLSENLSISYNLGSLLAALLSIQMSSGVVLSFTWPSLSFTVWMLVAVSSFDRLMLAGLCLIHSSVATMTFATMYIHIFKAWDLDLSSSLRSSVLSLGMTILMISIVTSFLGYVLPWCQMSYWALVVITSTLSVVPWLGLKLIVTWWGSSTIVVDSYQRVVMTHYESALLMSAIVMFHLSSLHSSLSSSLISLDASDDSRCCLVAYHMMRDASIWFVVVSFILPFITMHSEVIERTDNNIFASTVATPSHIVPEWYLCFYYGMLRSVPNKALGVVLVAFTLVSLASWYVVTSVSIMSSLIMVDASANNVMLLSGSNGLWSYFITCLWIYTTMAGADHSTPYLNAYLIVQSSLLAITS